MVLWNVIAANIFGIHHLLIYKKCTDNTLRFLKVKAVVGLHRITTVFQRAEKQGMKMGLESSQF
jgi:hypothetical protein